MPGTRSAESRQPPKSLYLRDAETPIGLRATLASGHLIIYSKHQLIKKKKNYSSAPTSLHRQYIVDSLK